MFSTKSLPQVSSGHKATISHELIAGAAAYEAAKAYEKHCAENGKPSNHACVHILSIITANFSLAYSILYLTARQWSSWLASAVPS